METRNVNITFWFRWGVSEGNQEREVLDTIHLYLYFLKCLPAHFRDFAGVVCCNLIFRGTDLGGEGRGCLSFPSPGLLPSAGKLAHSLQQRCKNASREMDFFLWGLHLNPKMWQCYVYGDFIISLHIINASTYAFISIYICIYKLYMHLHIIYVYGNCLKVYGEKNVAYFEYLKLHLCWGS